MSSLPTVRNLKLLIRNMRTGQHLKLAIFKHLKAKDMKKAELIKHVASHANVTQGQAEDVINALTSAIRDTVRAGGEIALPDLGKFSSTNRAARTSRNPRTGETVEVAAKRVPKFSPATSFKQLLTK